MFNLNLATWTLGIHDVLLISAISIAVYLGLAYWTNRMPDYHFGWKTTVSGVILNGLLWIYFFNYYVQSLSSMLIALSISVVIMIIYIDFKYYEIPNEYNSILTILGIAFVILNLSHWKYFVLGGIILFAILLVFFILSRGGLGAGDVKMSFGIGLLMGSPYIIPFLVYTFLFAAIVSIVLLLTKKMSMKGRIAFGPYMAIGYLICILPITLFF